MFGSNSNGFSDFGGNQPNQRVFNQAGLPSLDDICYLRIGGVKVPHRKIINANGEEEYIRVDSNPRSDLFITQNTPEEFRPPQRQLPEEYSEMYHPKQQGIPRERFQRQEMPTPYFVSEIPPPQPTYVQQPESDPFIAENIDIKFSNIYKKVVAFEEISSKVDQISGQVGGKMDELNQKVYDIGVKLQQQQDQNTAVINDIGTPLSVLIDLITNTVVLQNDSTQDSQDDESESDKKVSVVTKPQNNKRRKAKVRPPTPDESLEDEEDEHPKKSSQKPKPNSKAPKMQTSHDDGLDDLLDSNAEDDVLPAQESRQPKPKDDLDELLNSDEEEATSQPTSQASQPVIKSKPPKKDKGHEQNVANIKSLLMAEAGVPQQGTISKIADGVKGLLGFGGKNKNQNQESTTEESDTNSDIDESLGANKSNKAPPQTPRRSPSPPKKNKLKIIVSEVQSDGNDDGQSIVNNPRQSVRISSKPRATASYDPILDGLSNSEDSDGAQRRSPNPIQSKRQTPAQSPRVPAANKLANLSDSDSNAGAGPNDILDGLSDDDDKKSPQPSYVPAKKSKPKKKSPVIKQAVSFDD